MAWEESYEERRGFARVRNAETQYGRQLRAIASQIGNFVQSFASAGVDMDVIHLSALLERYAGIITPWARATAQRFIAEIARRDENAWARYSKNMSRALEAEIRSAPTGEALRDALEEQVRLITSLPLEAAQRVHKIAIGRLYEGARDQELIEHILETGHVTRSRATLIARTETSRVSSLLTQVRAKHIGSEGYIWRTIKDPNVRPSHRKMEGKFIRWDDPPVVDPGVPPYHAGSFPNCRCFAEVVIPDRYKAA